MNELTRYVLLLTALVNELLTRTGINRADPGLRSILTELDALTMVLSLRARGAINYHLTDTGKANLEEASRIAEALAAGEVTESWETRHWSLEQAQGPIFPDSQPEKVRVHERDLRGITLMSDELVPHAAPDAPSPEPEPVP